MKIPARENVPEPLGSDPWLMPYMDVIDSRKKRAQELEERLTSGKGSLAEFSSAHEYFGLHRQWDCWVFREWAPLADKVILYGDFSDWDKLPEYALEPIGGGVWEIRIPLEKLAVMTGSTMEEVAAAIQNLEERKIILRYAPIINWDRTDRERVEAMIEVRVTPQRDMGFDAIARRIYRFDEVKSVYLMSGSYDLLVLVEARTLKELAAFVSGKLSPLETVTGTATSFVLKRYKEEGVIFESDDTDRRLVISP